MLARDSAAHAILEVAMARDANLIVVGAHRHDAIGRLIGLGTADIVASLARRCVLAVPVEAADI